LFLDGGEASAPVVRLGLDDADGLPIGEQDIVGRADVCLILADGHAQAGVEIERVLVLNVPTGRPQTFIDPVPGDLLRRLVGIEVGAGLIFCHPCTAPDSLTALAVGTPRAVKAHSLARVRSER
jgi:hypothetical protein